MKLIAYLLAFVCLFSCKEKVEEVSKNTVTNVEIASAKKAYKGAFSVVDYASLEPMLTKKNDTTYVVNFWATWCRPCIKELPYFEEIRENYSEEKVKVLLVSLDFPDKIKAQVIPFIQKNNIKSEVILLDDADANNWIPKVSEEWSGAIPATIIYKNNERKFYEQSFTYQELKNEIESIIHK